MPEEPQKSPVSRSALVTAIGIILGFTLTFFEHWNEAPGDWRARHIPALASLALGGALLVISLYRALIPHDQTVRRYEYTARLFVAGVTLVLAGFILAVLI